MNYNILKQIEYKLCQAFFDAEAVKDREKK